MFWTQALLGEAEESRRRAEEELSRSLDEGRALHARAAAITHAAEQAVTLTPNPSTPKYA